MPRHTTLCNTQHSLHNNFRAPARIHELLSSVSFLLSCICHLISAGSTMQWCLLIYYTCLEKLGWMAPKFAKPQSCKICQSRRLVKDFLLIKDIDIGFVWFPTFGWNPGSESQHSPTCLCQGHGISVEQNAKRLFYDLGANAVLTTIIY